MKFKKPASGIKQKLRETSGVTIIFAMAVFLIAAVFSLTMVSGALAAARSAAAQREDEQAYLSAASAVSLLVHYAADDGIAEEPRNYVRTVEVEFTPSDNDQSEPEYDYEELYYIGGEPVKEEGSWAFFLKALYEMRKTAVSDTPLQPLTADLIIFSNGVDEIEDAEVKLTADPGTGNITADITTASWTAPIRIELMCSEYSPVSDNWTRTLTDDEGEELGTITKKTTMYRWTVESLAQTAAETV